MGLVSIVFYGFPSFADVCFGFGFVSFIVIMCLIEMFASYETSKIQESKKMVLFPYF